MFLADRARGSEQSPTAAQRKQKAKEAAVALPVRLVLGAKAQVVGCFLFV